MADVADRGQAVEEMQRDLALRRTLAAIPRGASPARCRWCGDPIPPARRKAVPGTELCIDCQEETEAVAQRGAL